MALLKVVAASDVIGAQLAVIDALAGKQALLISATEPLDSSIEVAGDVAFVVESSGSTGTPKRLRHTAESALAAARLSQQRLGATGQWLLTLPTNYVAGLNVLVRSAVAETQPVIMNTAVSFTPESFVRHASMMTNEHRFTALVPTQLNRLANVIDQEESVLRALRSFDAILLGGQAANQDVLERLLDLCVNIVETYGAAETFGGVVYNSEPLDEVSVSLEEDQRIAIVSPTLSIDAQPKFISNDIGDYSNGRLTVLGRADRVVNSGGIKFSLDRVEAIAASIPGVVEIAATPLSDAEWGQRVGIAYLGSPEVADEIATQLADVLGPAAVPLRVVRVDRVPKLSSQKHDLAAIAQLFERE